MNIQSGIFWIILTVFLEARDQTPIGQKNIVKVILNRMNKNQCSAYDVVFKKLQFSCYNNGLMEAFEAVAKEAKHIIPVTENVNDAIEEWKNGNNLKGATLYFNPKLVPGGWPATWNKSKTRIVSKEEDHVFLVEV